MGKHNIPPGGRKGPDERDYPIGYGKPPEGSRFKKGKSGNPDGGRKRKAPSVKDTLDKLLAKELMINTPEGPVATPAGEVVLMALMKKAASGSVQAAKVLLELMEKNGVGATPEVREFEPADQELLDQVFKDMGMYE